jgi:hypothetical protein
MADEKYSRVDETTMLAFLANALSGGGDRGQAFPYSDAEDMSRGLRFIPGEVTVARREGMAVPFMDQHCSHPCCWYWQFPNGARTYYFERGDYEQIGKHNGKEVNPETGGFVGGAGTCPECGNIHTRGGLVKADEIGKKA